MFVMASRTGKQDVFRFIHDRVNTEMDRAIDERSDNVSNHIAEKCAEIGCQVETARDEDAQETLRSHPEDLRRFQATIAAARETLQNSQRQAMLT